MKTLSKMDLMAICLCCFGMGVASSVAVYGTYTVANEAFEKHVQDTTRDTISENYAVKSLQERVAALEVKNMQERADKFAGSLLKQMEQAAKENQAFLEGN